MFIGNHFKQTTYLAYLVLPRFLLAYLFLREGAGKLNSRFLGTELLAQQLSYSVLKDPISLHQDFIQGVVIAHPEVFSYIVCFGEIAIGVSLLLGFLVRVFSSYGVFLNLNILLAISFASPGSHLVLNLLCVALHVAFLLSGAGRVIGVDGFLKKKFPQVWLF